MVELPVEAKTQRSELTLAAILDTALAMAATGGLESLTIGEVAKRLGISKSGVFSRVGSRKALQQAVIGEFDRRFVREVLVPTMREPCGLPRLNAIVELWIRRAENVGAHSGCLFSAGSFEYDERHDPLREQLLDGIRRWRTTLRRTAIQAIGAGHLRADTDVEQLVFELDGLFIALMREARFMRDARAGERTWAAYERLIRSLQPRAARGSG